MDCSDWLAEYSAQAAQSGALNTGPDRSLSSALSLKTFKRVFDAFDRNGDQQLSLNEFKALCGALKAASAEQGADTGTSNFFENFMRVLGSRRR